MIGIGAFLIFSMCIGVGFYLGILASKTDKDIQEYTDPVIDSILRVNAKEERIKKLKKKYGFDDSYDKYIA